MHAFPQNEVDAYGVRSVCGGMDLRDYFAAKAMQGLCANPEMNREWGHKEISEWAYEAANAMMKARGKND